MPMTHDQAKNRPWIHSKPTVDRVTGEIAWEPPLTPEFAESLRLGLEQQRAQMCSVPHHAKLAANLVKAGRHEMEYWAGLMLSCINLRPMETSATSRDDN